MGFLPAALLPLSLRAEFPTGERFKLLYQRLKRAEEDAERREVSLAGVSTAAAGWIGPENIAKPTDWAWHPAYQDTVNLRRKFDAAVRLIADSTAVTHMVMLYPCGCSATGHAPILDSSGIPKYCPDHGDINHPNGHAIYGTSPVKLDRWLAGKPA